MSFPTTDLIEGQQHPVEAPVWEWDGEAWVRIAQYATAAQGAKADTAVQPAELAARVPVLTSITGTSAATLVGMDTTTGAANTAALNAALLAQGSINVNAANDDRLLVLRGRNYAVTGRINVPGRYGGGLVGSGGLTSTATAARLGGGVQQGLGTRLVRVAESDWTGAMIRVPGRGTRLGWLSLYGAPVTEPLQGGATVPPANQSAVGLELMESVDAPAAELHLEPMAICFCDVGLLVGFEGEEKHGDHIVSNYLDFERCGVCIRVNNSDATHLLFNFVRVSNPTTHAIQVLRGVGLSIQTLAVNHPCTVLEYDDVNGSNHRTDIGTLVLDNQANGAGLRLVKMLRARSLAVRMGVQATANLKTLTEPLVEWKLSINTDDATDSNNTLRYPHPIIEIDGDQNVPGVVTEAFPRRRYRGEHVPVARTSPTPASTIIALDCEDRSGWTMTGERLTAATLGTLAFDDASSGGPLLRHGWFNHRPTLYFRSRRLTTTGTPTGLVTITDFTAAGVLCLAGNISQGSGNINTIVSNHFHTSATKRWGVDVWTPGYSTGTITTSGAVVTLSGGAFPTWVIPGSTLTLPAGAENNPPAETLAVATRDSDTQMTLAASPNNARTASAYTLLGGMRLRFVMRIGTTEYNGTYSSNSLPIDTPMLFWVEREGSIIRITANGVTTTFVDQPTGATQNETLRVSIGGDHTSNPFEGLIPSLWVDNAILSAADKQARINYLRSAYGVW